jgi:hypothetical protein
MRKLELTTDLIGINGFCTYWGAGRSEYVLNEDSIEEDFKEKYTNIHPDYYWTYFDNQQYMADWSNAVHEYLDGKIYDAFRNKLDMEITYTAEGYSSPREYNFRGDWQIFDIDCTSFVPLLRYCLSREKEFEEFLRKNYTSYDGFLSFTSNNVYEWKLDIRADKMTAWGAAVRFFLEREGDFGEDDKYYIGEDMYYTNYVDYEPLDLFLEELRGGRINPADFTNDWQKALFERDICDSAQVVSEIKGMYLSGDSNEKIAAMLQEKYGEYPFENIIDKVFGEIESNNLKLEL